jgi:hypothetical protein
MNEDEESRGTIVELLLHEPEIVAWLEDYRPELDEAPNDDDDDAPAAA